MLFQAMPARNDELPPTQPAFQMDDKKAFTIGAWAGVCFALALIGAAAITMVRAPDASKGNTQASAPTVALPSTN